MPITTSLDPIDIVRENAELLLLEDNTTHPEWWTSELFEENQQDSQYKARVFLERPLKEQGKVLMQANVESSYPLSMYFYERSNLADLQADLEPIYKRMRKLVKQFIVLLMNDGRIKSLSGYNAVEVVHVLDRDNSGIYLTLTIVVTSTVSVCVP